MSGPSFPDGPLFCLWNLMAKREEQNGERSQSSTANSEIVTQEGSAPGARKNNRQKRSDAGRLHATRHGVVARYPLEALRHLGEDPSVLRRIEKGFRAELKPQGAIAEVLFDRFFSSYLRCLLAARVESSMFLRQRQEHNNENLTSKLLTAPLPTLIVEKTVESGLPKGMDREVLNELALVQRYDSHFSKEMLKALGLLLVLRRNGEAGLEAAFCNLFGVEG